MRKILFILFLCCSSVSLIYSQQSPWQWVNPLPQGNPLNGIWALNKDTAFSVGGYGTILRTSNGGVTWSVGSASAGVIDQLFAIKFISNSIGWAVGEGGQVLKTMDGGEQWSEYFAPTVQDLYALDFASDSIGWVVGRSGNIFSTTDGGVNWLPKPSGTTISLYAVSFIDKITGWVAGGSGKILKTTDGGNTWNPQTSGITTGLFAFHFLTSQIGWVTGSSGVILKTVNGGTSWVPQFSGTGMNLYSLQFANSTTGWAAGAYGTIIKTTNSGISWFQQTTTTYNDFFGLRMASSNEGWAVGDFGTIYATANGGAIWEAKSTGPKNEFFSAAFPTPNTGWAVGDEGIIMKSTNAGLSWIKQNSGFFLPLYDVDFISSSFGWAVGDSAVVLRTTNGGTTWTKQNSHTDISLYSIDFVNSSTGWAVGDAGTILKSITGGLNWITQTSNTFATLQKVKFINDTLGWAVGYSGTILKTIDGGTTWFEQTSGTGQTLYSVSFINQNVGYASGDFGVVLSTVDGGDTWNLLTTNTDASLYDIAFSSASTGWAVGDDGIIMYTNDGGTTWAEQKSGTSNILFKLQFVRSGSGGVLFTVGVGGTVICSSISPLPVRTWTGIFDNQWFASSNWNPIGIPEKFDSVVISSSSNQPIIRLTTQQINISALRIAPGTTLSIGPELGELNVKNTIDIGGTLNIDSTATTQILAGGSFLTGVGGKFIPGKSSVGFTSKGQVKGTFYNMVISEGAEIQSIGNVEIKNTLMNLSTFSLRTLDTLIIRNSDSFSLQGSGTTGAGTIKRAIRPGSTELYRFESPVTYLRFLPGGTLPDTVLMTTFPNTLGTGLKDSLFVKRYYSITAKGGSNYNVLMSLRYDTAESKIPIDELALFRDSSGVLMNMGVTDYLDSSDYLDNSLTAILLDSVKSFSNWFLGQQEYFPKHPYEFLDTLYVNDNGVGFGILLFGSSPGASDGLDTTYGEVQLSPKPAPGIFDARWSISPTRGSLTDLRDVFRGNKTQNIYSSAIQPSVAGSIVLRWNRTILPAGAFFLRDSVTQGGQFNINMKLQSSYTITNPTIKTVQIVATVPRYYSYNRGWNMMALSLTSATDKRKVSVFPTASSFAYKYSSGYFIEDTLKNGRGYWLKFSSAQTIAMDGFARIVDTINVTPGWNMIGSVSYPVAISSIGQIPTNNAAGNYYSYSGGYYLSDSIRPGKGYWIKVAASGKLILNYTGPVNKQTSHRDPFDEISAFNTVAIGDREGNNQTLFFGKPTNSSFQAEQYELPPTPPSGIFDARFASHKLVEVTNNEHYSTTIAVQPVSFPLTVQWHIVQSGIRSIILSDAVTGSMISRSSDLEGSIQIINRSITMINLTVESAEFSPKEFSLKQNYPNPFNPATNIEFEIPTQSVITLKVYNLLGQEITTLVDNISFASGRHVLTFDGSNIASGIYFYQLIARGSNNKTVQQVRKMLLMK